MSSQKHISLAELQRLIKEGIDAAHPLPYWVVAEVSECKVNSSGHCYLELIEQQEGERLPSAKVRATIWRSTYQMVASYFRSATGRELGAGMRVLFKGVISYHPLYGLSFQITDLDPAYTLGEIAQQRSATIEQLKADDVYEMNRELPLPEVIQRLAIVSSSRAAGYQDFMNELGASPYHFATTLFEATMQGEGAEGSILTALDQIAEVWEHFDCVVLIRGGGAQSDLACFDSYTLCMHLAQFPLPILSGIGHDKDESVADLVAARSLKTPTAVAVYLREEMAAFDARLWELSQQLATASRELLLQEQQRLQQAAHSLDHLTRTELQEQGVLLVRYQSELKHHLVYLTRHSSEQLLRFEEALASLSTRLVAGEEQVLKEFRLQLCKGTQEVLRRAADRLAWQEQSVALHDPQRILAKGYARVSFKGRNVADLSQLQTGDLLQIETQQGAIEAAVTAVKSNQSKRKKPTK